MIKHILTVGDSFTYGEELTDLQNAWPYKLGQKTNSNIINLAKPGSGNKRMIRHVVHEVLESTQPIDLVIVAWSSPGRMEFADSDGIFDIWPGYSGNMFKAEQPWRVELLNYIDRYHDDEWIYKQYLLDVILLQSFLKERNIRYLMCKTMGSDYYHHNYFLTRSIINQKIDTNYFIGWPSEGMSEWTFGTDKGPYGHFLEEGHQKVANKIYEHIRHFGWIS